MKKRKTLNEFINEARKVHGDKYDYSKVEYINNRTKVCIICPIHGEFWQTPSNHLKGQRCPKCYGNIKNTTEEFIEKARKVHGDKYDYSKTQYINHSTKVCIICPIHGEFWQTPNKHIYRKHGCPKCYTNEKLELKGFIEKARKVHGDKYDYSKVKYINNRTKVCIICPIHGEFLQTPSNHLKGQGCKECFEEKIKTLYNLSTEEFIEKARKIHGNKYDYSKTEYINNSTKVCIICPIHGEFWQTPANHLCGNGCPKCNQSHLENEIMQFLQDNNIEYIPQHTFGWLINKNNLSLDFYLPKYNIAIECQGIQHFKTSNFFGGENGFKDTIKRDNIKRALCESNGVKILYYSNLGIEYPYKVFEDKQLLLEEINKN